MRKQEAFMNFLIGYISAGVPKWQGKSPDDCLEYLRKAFDEHHSDTHMHVAQDDLADLLCEIVNADQCGFEEESGNAICGFCGNYSYKDHASDCPINKAEMFLAGIHDAQKSVAKLRATQKAYEIALAGIPDSYAEEVKRRVLNLMEGS